MILPPVRGVDLASGPAFVWWKLLLGAGIVLAGAGGLAVTRLGSARVLPGVLAVRLVLFAVVLLGAAAMVRSFRTA